MTVRRGGSDDLADLTRLLLAFSGAEAADADGFEAALGRWIAEHQTSHVPFLAYVAGEAVGMAWLALTARVARPARAERRSGDLQSVFVLPEYRGRGLGQALVEAACECADGLGAEHVTVHSNSAALGLYRRAGFVSAPEMLHRPRGALRTGSEQPAITT